MICLLSHKEIYFTSKFSLLCIECHIFSVILFQAVDMFFLLLILATLSVSIYIDSYSSLPLFLCFAHFLIHGCVVHSGLRCRTDE